jgi:hypothetical protein
VIIRLLAFSASDNRELYLFNFDVDSVPMAQMPEEVDAAKGASYGFVVYEIIFTIIISIQALAKKKENNMKMTSLNSDAITICLSFDFQFLSRSREQLAERLK